MTRHALVVGAAGGIGTEVVKQLLQQGYQVTATVLNQTEVDHLQNAAPNTGKILELDLSNADNVLAKLNQLKLSSLDAVVVCAAISPAGPLEIAPLATLRRTFEINTIAAAAIFQACMPALRATQGRLILISSFAGKIGLPFLGHYTASKFALEGLGDVMRREAKASGVDVVIIEPGAIRTPMTTGQPEIVARERAALSPEQVERFGALYDGYAAAVNNALDKLTEPAVVADTVIEALHANPPQMRYQVGEDAKFLCDAARKSDAEIDAIVAAFGS